VHLWDKTLRLYGVKQIGNTYNVYELERVAQNYDENYNLHELWQDLHNGDVFIRNYENHNGKIVRWKQLLTGDEHDILRKAKKNVE
jgi:flagellar biosynthesis/type III secretory pathway chaperone